MTRARQKMFDEEGDDQQQCQDDAADPPGNWSPPHMHGCFLQELKEEDTGGGEDGSGKQESGTEDQRDAVLGALKADQDDGSENEGEQTGSDLQIALQDGVRLKRHNAQPHREKKEHDES